MGSPKGRIVPLTSQGPCCPHTAHRLLGRSTGVKRPLLQSGSSRAAEVCHGLFYRVATFPLTCLALSVRLCMENCQLFF